MRGLGWFIVVILIWLLVIIPAVVGWFRRLTVDELPRAHYWHVQPKRLIDWDRQIPEWRPLQLHVGERIEGICQGRAVAVHHKKLRSHGRDDSPSNTASLCAACHRHTHANPAESYATGRLIHSWDAKDTGEVYEAEVVGDDAEGAAEEGQLV